MKNLLSPTLVLLVLIGTSSTSSDFETRGGHLDYCESDPDCTDPFMFCSEDKVCKCVREEEKETAYDTGTGICQSLVESTCSDSDPEQNPP